MHALPQREQIAVYRDLHDGLSVDLDDQAPALLLHGDLQRTTGSRLKRLGSAEADEPSVCPQPSSTGRR